MGEKLSNTRQPLTIGHWESFQKNRTVVADQSGVGQWQLVVAVLSRSMRDEKIKPQIDWRARLGQDPSSFLAPPPKACTSSCKTLAFPLSRQGWPPLGARSRAARVPGRRRRAALTHLCGSGTGSRHGPSGSPCRSGLWRWLDTLPSDPRRSS